MSNSRPLAPVEGHDVDHLLRALTLPVHDQAHMVEEGGEALEFGKRTDQLLQVLEPAGSGGRAVLLPHLGIAGLVEHRGLPPRHGACAARAARQPRKLARSGRLSAERALRLQLVGLDSAARPREGGRGRPTAQARGSGGARPRPSPAWAGSRCVRRRGRRPGAPRRGCRPRHPESPGARRSAGPRSRGRGG